MRVLKFLALLALAHTLAVFQTSLAAPISESTSRDPKLNYSGMDCRYFTKEKDKRFYADGAWVAYGEWMYLCRQRKWQRMGPAKLYTDAERLKAEVLER
jgi:hypothetical protein